jgi:cystathionine gamma-lyase
MGEKPARGEPLPFPLVPASTFHLAGDPEGAPFVYGRNGNPTWSGLESQYAKLGGAPCVTFASGMAACAAVFDALLPRGARVVAPSDGYYTLRRFLALRGVETTLVASTNPMAFAEAAPGAAVVWVETPTNPGLDVVDLQATADACKRAGALLVADNTLATALGQDPFAFGVDVVVVSATKMTSGHHDALIGIVEARDVRLLEKVRAVRTVTGAVPGVLEAWLCARGLKTLEIRLARSSASALALAERLPASLSVRYPGLPRHPHHDVAAKQMKHFGCVLSFDLGTRERAEAFCRRLEHIAEATSFGGTDSTLERRARWGGDAVSPGLVRLSVGLEEPELLLSEILRALD